MSVRLRLQRRGKKKEPFYRLVATNRSAGPQSGYIEALGYYQPEASGEEQEVELDGERIDYWLDNGAQPSSSVKDLLRKAGVTAEE